MAVGDLGAPLIRTDSIVIEIQDMNACTMQRKFICQSGPEITSDPTASPPRMHSQRSHEHCIETDPQKSLNIIERNFNLRVTFTRNLDKMRHDIPNIQ